LGGGSEARPKVAQRANRDRRTDGKLLMMAKAASKIPNHIRETLSLNVSPRYWLEKARKLRKSANLLFIEYESEQSEFIDKFERDPSVSGASRPDDDVVVLLLGLGIENLLKGLFVGAVGPPPGKVQKLKDLKFPGGPHELAPVADEVGKLLQIKFSDEERGIIQALEYYIRWRGRYPSAADVENSIPINDNGFFKKFILYYPNDHFDTISLYNKLECQLEARVLRGSEGA
jgi:hypothetical protein